MMREIKLGLSDHPGTMWMVLFVVMGFLAGFTGDEEIKVRFLWGLGGAGLMLLFFGPLYLYGAYECGKHLLSKEKVE